MSTYRVRIRRKRGLRQQFHVLIVAANGETQFTSENYRDLDHARTVARGVAAKLNAKVEDET